MGKKKQKMLEADHPTPIKRYSLRGRDEQEREQFVGTVMLHLEGVHDKMSLRYIAQAIRAAWIYGREQIMAKSLARLTPLTPEIESQMAEYFKERTKGERDRKR